MDDNIIYYLVLGAIYLVSRMLKKKKPVPTNAPRPLYEDDDAQNYQEPAPHSPSPSKPASFEDLLKEISNEFNERKEPRPIIAEVEAPIEVIEPVSEVREKTREEKYVEKRHKEMAAEKRIKELNRLAAEEEHEPHAVMELLQEDGGAANAIILSEILNKKY